MQIDINIGKKKWHSVFFSDEIYFTLGSNRKARVIQKSNKKFCEDYIQYF
jgi:hypothetical protein